MSTNKSISYLLCNKSIIVNLYKLHFFILTFLFNQTKKNFILPLFHPSNQTHTRGKTKYFLSSKFSIRSLIFHPPTFLLLQPNRHLRNGWDPSRLIVEMLSVVTPIIIVYPSAYFYKGRDTLGVDSNRIWTTEQLTRKVGKRISTKTKSF